MVCHYADPIVVPTSAVEHGRASKIDDENRVRLNRSSPNTDGRQSRWFREDIEGWTLAAQRFGFVKQLRSIALCWWGKIAGDFRIAPQ
jgi:hypothetical protein